MTGEYGAQCYLTAPMRMVRCSEADLYQLHRDLDKIFWDEKEGMEITYARHEPGDYVYSGKDGGRIKQDLWMHKDLVDLDLESRVRRVLEGNAARIGSPEEIAGLRSRFTELLRKENKALRS